LGNIVGPDDRQGLNPEWRGPVISVAYAAGVPLDDPTPEVDFVAHEIDGGGFEELPQPPERPGLRRWRVPLTIAGGLVAAAVVTAAIVVQSSSSTPTAAPATPVSTPTSKSTSTSTSKAPTPARTHQPSIERPFVVRPAAPLDFLAGLSSAEIAAARTKCPRLAPTCTTTGEAPTDVLAAVHAVFPQARRLLVLSDVAYQISSGASLAYRRISARSGRTTIAVEIRASTTADTARFGVSYRGRRAYATAEIRMRGLTIEVQASTPQPRTPSVRAVQRLAADRRLLATG
jgi:hypothetical protein